MNKYKVGDMVEIKKGDRAIIVDFENDEAIIFNLSKMHPGKIKVKEIKKKVCEPNCKVVVEKVNSKETDENPEEQDLEDLVEDLEAAMVYNAEKMRDCVNQLTKKLQEIIEIINDLITETEE